MTTHTNHTGDDAAAVFLALLSMSRVWYRQGARLPGASHEAEHHSQLLTGGTDRCALLGFLVAANYWKAEAPAMHP